MGHYLSFLLALPVCGAAVVLCIPERQNLFMRTTARVVAACALLTALPLWTWYRPTDPEFQFVERVLLMPRMGIGYVVGIDGISLMFLILTALLGLVATLVPLRDGATSPESRSYATLLIHEAALLGVFLSLDTLMFTVCWLAALVTMWMMLARWSGVGGRTVASRFAVWSALSFVAVAVGFALLALVARETNSAAGFDLAALQKLAVSPALQGWIAGAFLLGFVLAMSLVPARAWLPGALSEAPPGVAVMLAGGLVNVGVFGLARFCLPLAADAVRQASPYVAGLASLVVVIAAVLAMRQSDWLRVVGYLSMSQAAVSLLGLMTPTPGAVTGSVVLAVTRGLATPAAVMAVAWVAARVGRHDIVSFRGLRSSLSVATTLVFVVAVLSIASPIANGWVGESRIAAAVSTAHSRLLLTPAVLGVLLTSIWAALRSYQTFFARSPLSSADLKFAPPNLAEVSALSIVTLALLATGLLPDPLVSRVHLPALKVAARVDSRYEAEFLAACDTTVTPELKAASFANQFLAAAPCGPDGKPLVSPVSEPSTSGTGIR